MNYNNKSNGQNRWRTFSLVLLCLLVVVSIIYMKRSSGEQKQLIPIGATDSSHMQVAVPDTTIDPVHCPKCLTPCNPHNSPTQFLARTSATLMRQAMTMAMQLVATMVQHIPKKPIMMKPTTLPPLPKNKTMFVAIVRAIHRATKTDEMANNSIFK